MNDDHATRADIVRLEHRIDASAAELRGEFRAANNELRNELRGEFRGALAETEQRMLWEIGHAINAGVEQTAKLIRVLDDKYTDLPARVAALERDH